LWKLRGLHFPRLVERRPLKNKNAFDYLPSRK
jgi:hypothetical protein